MRLESFPGGWYSWALPWGEYAVLIRDVRIETHLGPVPLDQSRRRVVGRRRGARRDQSGDNALFLTATNVGGWRFAGQSHAGRGTLEWSAATGWRVVGNSFGVNPQIYDQAGVLRMATASHQGWRYVRDDGTLATGDETYADPFRELGEWTEHGDLTVGFHNYTLVVWVGPEQRRRIIARGTIGANSVHFNRDGDQCVVSWHGQDVNTTYILWFTRSEVTQFPTEPDPHPDPDPDPNPDPQPEPSMKLPDDVFATLVALRPKYPTPLGDRGAALLNAVAWTHRAAGWGLEAKAGGTTCPQPRTSIACGCDILRTRDRGWDVLLDAEGAGTPVQSESGPADPARFVPPVDPGTLPDPDPNPQPDPALTARVARLEQQVQTLSGDVADLTEQQMVLLGDLDDLTTRVLVLEARPVLTPADAAALQQLHRLLAVLQTGLPTSRNLSHSHTVRWS